MPATQTQTTVNELPAWQRPYVQYGMGQMQNWYNSNQPRYYGGQTVAGFSPMQQRAFGNANWASQQNKRMGGAGSNFLTQTVNNANKIDPYAQNAMNFTQGVMNGSMSGDPYAGAVFKGIESKVLPSVNSQFSSSGRLGSGSHANSASDGLVNAFAPYASQQAENAKNRQMQAAGMIPGLSQAMDKNKMYAFQAAGQMPGMGQMGWQNAQNQYGMGQQQQNFAQRQQDDAQKRWDFQQNLPYQRIQQYMQGISGNYGNNTTQTMPKPQGQSNSMWGNLLGGATSLLGAYFGM